VREEFSSLGQNDDDETGRRRQTPPEIKSMSPDSPSSPLLSGHLLLAGPELLSRPPEDGSFSSQHSPEDGALGYILNPPDRDRSRSPPWDSRESGLGVAVGGPVGKEHLTFAAISWDSGSQSLICRTHLQQPKPRSCGWRAATCGALSATPAGHRASSGGGARHQSLGGPKARFRGNLRRSQRRRSLVPFDPPSQPAPQDPADMPDDLSLN